MISTIKEKPNGGFYCSECRISLPNITENCPFCGSWISNYQEMLVKNFKEKERDTNEDNIYRRD